MNGGGGGYTERADRPPQLYIFSFQIIVVKVISVSISMLSIRTHPSYRYVCGLVSPSCPAVGECNLTYPSYSL